jgi:hypothetical protein
MTTPTTPTPTAPKTTLAPQAAPAPSSPTPTQHENDQFRLAQADGTLPPVYAFKADGSPVDPHAFDPTQKPPTWP